MGLKGTQVDDLAVTNAKIANSTVTSAKMAVTQAFDEGMPMQNFCRHAGASVEGETWTIGGVVFECRDSTPPAGGTAGRIWITRNAAAAVTRANLVNAINGVVDAPNITYNGVTPPSMLATDLVAVTAGLAIASATAPGGTPAPSASATACSTTVVTGTDGWSNATCQCGRIASATGRRITSWTYTVIAKDVTAGYIQFYLPYTSLCVHHSVPAAPTHEGIDALAIAGNQVRIALGGAGILAADVVHFIATE